MRRRRDVQRFREVRMDERCPEIQRGENGIECKKMRKEIKREGKSMEG